MKKLIVALMILLFPFKFSFSQSDTQVSDSEVVQNFKPGLINISEFSAGFGIGETNVDYAKSFFGLTSILGYGFTKNLQTGIGTGLLFYNGGLLVPVYLDLRFMINFGKI